MYAKTTNSQREAEIAICHFHENTQTPTLGVDNGSALLTQYHDKTVIALDLYNLTPGVKGFHIHDSNNMSEGCNSLGSHYNPHNKSHGGLNASISHFGDLGNITVNDAGRCTSTIIVNNRMLSGEYNVIGRSMVIHSNPDDLGLGQNEESLKSGNSGARISCGIIEAL